MDKQEMKYFEKLLLKEKKSMQNTLDRMNDNIENSQFVNNELSNYDNHPGDSGTETFDSEMYQNLKNNEIEQLEKIDAALVRIKKGTYGKCITCGKEIDRDRLEILPDAIDCIDCETDSLLLDQDEESRPAEEDLLDPRFYEDVYIGDEAWDAVASFNKTDKKKMGLDWYDNNMYE